MSTPIPRIPYSHGSKAVYNSLAIATFALSAALSPVVLGTQSDVTSLTSATELTVEFGLKSPSVMTPGNEAALSVVTMC